MVLPKRKRGRPPKKQEQTSKLIDFITSFYGDGNKVGTLVKVAEKDDGTKIYQLTYRPRRGKDYNPLLSPTNIIVEYSNGFVMFGVKGKTKNFTIDRITFVPDFNPDNVVIYDFDTLTDTDFIKVSKIPKYNNVKIYKINNKISIDMSLAESDFIKDFINILYSYDKNIIDLFKRNEFSILLYRDIYEEDWNKSPRITQIMSIYKLTQSDKDFLKFIFGNQYMFEKDKSFLKVIRENIKDRVKDQILYNFKSSMKLDYFTIISFDTFSAFKKEIFGNILELIAKETIKLKDNVKSKNYIIKNLPKIENFNENIKLLYTNVRSVELSKALKVIFKDNNIILFTPELDLYIDRLVSRIMLTKQKITVGEKRERERKISGYHLFSKIIRETATYYKNFDRNIEKDISDIINEIKDFIPFRIEIDLQIGEATKKEIKDKIIKNVSQLTEFLVNGIMIRGCQNY